MSVHSKKKGEEIQKAEVPPFVIGICATIKHYMDDGKVIFVA